MIIIEFLWGNKIVTWYVKKRTFLILSFLLSSLMSFVVRVWVIPKFNKRFNKTPKLDVTKPKGGANLYDLTNCVEPDKVYEIVSFSFKNNIRNFLTSFLIKMSQYSFRYQQALL